MSRNAETKMTRTGCPPKCQPGKHEATRKASYETGNFEDSSRGLHKA